MKEVRAAYRQELTEFLCGEVRPAAAFRPAGLLLQLLRTRERPWTPGEVEAAFGDVADDLFKDVDEIRERVRTNQEVILQDVRVLCLCENSASHKMWRDYAHQGRGVCIGFRYVPEIDNAIGAAKQVQYVEQWPSIATPLEWAREVLSFERIPFEERTRGMLYLKRRKFAHEQEWRIITKRTPETKADENGIYRVIIDAQEVAEIILGPAIKSSEEAELRDAARSFCPSAVMRTAAIDGRNSCP